MPFTLCTSGAIVTKAGRNVFSGAKVSGAILEQFSDEAEGLINVAGRYDYVANYSGLNSNAKKLLGEIASNLAGAYLIAYDMSGYTGRGEAEDMIMLLHDGAVRGLALLKEDKNRHEITGG